MDEKHDTSLTQTQVPSNTHTTTEQNMDTSSSPSMSLKERNAGDTSSVSKPKPDDWQTSGEAAPEEWIGGIQLFMVVAGITLVIFLMLLDMSIIATAIPRITDQFHSLEDVAWYGSAYTLASCALQPLTGKFYTFFKSKWVFLSFFAVFELGSVICGVATSSMMLIIGRAVAGMGSSGMINGALTILAGAVPMHKRPALIGMMMGFAQLGLVLGPLIGGAFTTKTTWRWCFYINLPIGGLVAILLLFTRVPEQRKKGRALDVIPTLHKTLDLVGFVLFAPAAIMFLLALEYGGNEYPWNDSRIIGLFVGAGATAIVFLGWEYYKGKEAMIPFHLITQRIAYSSYATVAVIFGLTMVMSYYLPIYFQSIRDESALDSGVNLLPNILAQLVSAVLSGVLIGKLGYYLPWCLGGAIFSAVGSGLLSTLSPTTSTAAWAGYQVLVGLGRGASTQAPMLAVQNGINPDDISTAMAVLTFSQTFGGSVFLAIASVIFSEGLKDQIPKFAPNVDTPALVAAGATGFRDLVSGDDLVGVVKGYAKAIDWVFYLVAALCVVQFAAAWGMGWGDVRKKSDGEKGVSSQDGKAKDEEKGQA
ncbi:major facilitator superfamily domain-containing protein [Aspergillus undulatus]|uniref:major facilitator superfamily domain-containing protein n=1 Tax=Aspergillus undulatus TaxID=1810928 RepID=UPI003CCE244A